MQEVGTSQKQADLPELNTSHDFPLSQVDRSIAPCRIEESKSQSQSNAINLPSSFPASQPSQFCSTQPSPALTSIRHIICIRNAIVIIMSTQLSQAQTQTHSSPAQPNEKALTEGRNRRPP